jgi:hypothetical protein
VTRLLALLLCAALSCACSGEDLAAPPAPDAGPAAEEAAPDSPPSDADDPLSCDAERHHGVGVPVECAPPAIDRGDPPDTAPWAEDPDHDLYWPAVL